MKRVIAISILSAMIVCFVAPLFMGDSNKNKTDVAAQEESTKQEIEDNKEVVTNPSEYEIEKMGYATSNTNVYQDTSLDSDIVEVIMFNSEITYYKYDEEWCLVKYSEDYFGYIKQEYITDVTCDFQEYKMPQNSGFKSYMPYKAIKSKSSFQYKLQRDYAYTGLYGIRQVEGRFCVAIGTFSNTPVGTYVDLVLENGVVIPCVISDFKADIHTDFNNIVTQHNGCLSEFLVDKSKLNEIAKQMGDISYCKEEWKSPVKIIKVYEKNVFDGE